MYKHKHNSQAYLMRTRHGNHLSLVILWQEIAIDADVTCLKRDMSVLAKNNNHRKITIAAEFTSKMLNDSDLRVNNSSAVPEVC